MLLAASFAVIATRFEGLRTDPIRGRWDLVITKGAEKSAGWLEVRASGTQTLIGRVMIGVGSARPISEVRFEKAAIHFSVPTQWESTPDTVTFDGKLEGNKLTGTVQGGDYSGAHVTGRRAPEMFPRGAVRWGRPVNLLRGSLDSNWKETPGWVLANGMLINKDPHADILSVAKFGDFRVHCEYRYPAGSNSGIYLRGRYEVQIEDDFDRPADSECTGGIYGLLTPLVNPAKRPGEWQSADVELVGRKVTVTLNGIKIIENQIIPGPTGGAIDADEASPGPLKLQGDHGPITFRKVVVWPREKR